MRSVRASLTARSSSPDPVQASSSADSACTRSSAEATAPAPASASSHSAAGTAQVPTDEPIAIALEAPGVDAQLATCKTCGSEILQATAHRHDNGWLGDSCCWDERLRMTA